ncbi:phage tail protein [Photorhabdus heterorhabditis]|uniref:phage tail protein n=1 Tax=Photorhabdus heterorhabditis TaxID=880156 RepID=UPI001C254793|nr:phage tail protein [Photorhabdus heterorhabditis]
MKNLGLVEKLIPVGVPLPWPTEIPPEGWVPCNGAAFDKSKFPELAKAYPSGNLPDLRGEFIRGWDDGRGVDQSRTLLSQQNSTRLPSVYVHAASADRGILVSPPVNTYSRAYPSEIMASDFEDSTTGSGPYYTTSTSLIPGGAVGLSAFRVRPRNIAFNYIVRAA